MAQALKTLLKVTAQHLTDSFLSLEARKWINAQNDKEFVRRNLDPKREVFVFSGRAGKLNKLQMEAFNSMHPHGWQAMAVAQRTSTNEFALVCRGVSNGMFGVVYPDGKLERSAARVELKGARWTPEAIEIEVDAEVEAIEKAIEAASTGVRPMVIPQAPEQFPSNAKGMQWDVESSPEPVVQSMKRVLLRPVKPLKSAKTKIKHGTHAARRTKKVAR